jgi:hypothetical protein
MKREEWMANSSDLSHMGFEINVIFKKLIFKKMTSTLDGLKRAARRVWADLNFSYYHNTMASWEGRVDKIIKRKGFQIENKKLLFSC